MEEIKVFEALGHNAELNQPRSVFIGYLRGTRTDCLKWLEVTRPGFGEEVAAGLSGLREMRVWEIDADAIEQAMEHKKG